MTLELDSSALPTLATNCVLVGHAQKADVVWTKQDFVGLCEIMRNGNDPHFFMIPYQKEDGTAHFAKAKKARAEKYATWAWDAITGNAKKRASIGFYPRNPDSKSRWAAMDFDGSDGHDNGDDESAREKALKAFRLLLRHSELFVVLCTSGSSGWHLFAFTHNFYPIEDWIRLLKQAAAMIGANIRKGECEIFPSDVRGQVGYGIRAPGTWNPKHDTFSLIAFENIGPLLSGQRGIASLASKEKRKGVSLSSRSKDGGDSSDLTYRNEKAVYRGEFDEWRARFAINEPRTRRQRLKEMVDCIFRQVGRQVARWNAEMQFSEKTVPTTATFPEHLKEFDEMWDWWEAQWYAELSESEREKFDVLRTDSHDRAAFRIFRNFAQFVSDSGNDFKIVAEHLAKRLGVTLQTACNIRRRFCAAGIIAQTAEYVPQKLAARFRWTAESRMCNPRNGGVFTSEVKPQGTAMPRAIRQVSITTDEPKPQAAEAQIERTRI
jgi:hypothetical protein